MQVQKIDHASQVDPKLRDIVSDAIYNNESVPFGVSLISCRQPTQGEIKRGMELEGLVREVLGRTRC